MTSPQLKNEKNYEILEQLGSGTSAKVYKIRLYENNRLYALKNVKLDRPEALAEAQIEYNILQRGIPNVLKSYGSYHEPNKMFNFSTELMEMSLKKFINNNGPITFENFIPLFKDIIKGRKKQIIFNSFL
jgi:serine/threonine protein kinase